MDMEIDFITTKPILSSQVSLSYLRCWFYNFCVFLNVLRGIFCGGFNGLFKVAKRFLILKIYFTCQKLFTSVLKILHLNKTTNHLSSYSAFRNLRGICFPLVFYTMMEIIFNIKADFFRKIIKMLDWRNLLEWWYSGMCVSSEGSKCISL